MLANTKSLKRTFKIPQSHIGSWSGDMAVHRKARTKSYGVRKEDAAQCANDVDAGDCHKNIQSFDGAGEEMAAHDPVRT